MMTVRRQIAARGIILGGVGLISVGVALSGGAAMGRVVGAEEWVCPSILLPNPGWPIWSVPTALAWPTTLGGCVSAGARADTFDNRAFSWRGPKTSCAFYLSSNRGMSASTA
jgi:hypothetical protein